MPAKVTVIGHPKELVPTGSVIWAHTCTVFPSLTTNGPGRSCIVADPVEHTHKKWHINTIIVAEEEVRGYIMVFQGAYPRCLSLLHGGSRISIYSPGHH